MKTPSKLSDLVSLCESLSDVERRDILISYAQKAPRFAPESGVEYDFCEVRKDVVCTDEVGVFARLVDGRVSLRVSLGAQVQTLTKALTAILCEVLEGATPEEVLAVDRGFVVAVIGEQMVRARSQTIYYVLDRIQELVGSFELAEQT